MKSPLLLASGIVVTLGVAAISALLYAVPPGYITLLGLCWECANLFRDAAPHILRVAPLDAATFTWLLRALLLVTWAAWVAMIASAARHGIRARWSALVGGLASLVLTLAVFTPPVLSRDVMGYVAFGRLGGAHGLNPYTHGKDALIAAGDPAATALLWGDPLPYGPLWTTMALGARAVGSIGGLLGEVIAHKVLAATALVITALAGAWLVGREHPSQAKLTFVAIGFNPLMLLEGPGSGHNDLLMLACAVVGATLCARERWSSGALALGIAGAIKPVALAAVPLLVFEYALRHRDRAYIKVLSLTALAALPFLVFSLPFGGPLAVTRGLFGRLDAGHVNRYGLAAAAALALLWGGRMIWTSRAKPEPAWLMAWAPTAAALILFGSHLRYPWYITWMLVPALTGWDERHKQWITVSVCAAVLLSWLYVWAP